MEGRVDSSGDLKENRELQTRQERRALYERRLRSAIRAFIEGDSDFDEMTVACDAIAAWYHRTGNYRERVLADPLTYGYAHPKRKR